MTGGSRLSGGIAVLLILLVLGVPICSSRS